MAGEWEWKGLGGLRLYLGRVRVGIRGKEKAGGVDLTAMVPGFIPSFQNFPALFSPPTLTTKTGDVCPKRPTGD